MSQERGERIPTTVFDQPQDVSVHVAHEIARLIRTRAEQARSCVLGLSTGSTPLAVYEELVRMHREENLSFANVVTFNLDEYYPMQPEALQSYRRFMQENLFDHVDLDPKSIHIPDGSIDQADVPRYCAAYEQAIVDAGGITVQLLGIGRTGHIGFNEPGSSKSSVTRLISLDGITRKDAASDFFGESNVPRRAITAGVQTISEADRIILLAFGEQKAPIIARAVEGEITDVVTASFLQEHPNAGIYLDRAAAAELTRFKCPWMLGPVMWDAGLIRKAVFWLARRTSKPILKLTDEDYNENALQDLLAEHGPAYDINLGVFRSLQHTITGWPGGKARDPATPKIRRVADPKRVLIFSPHPDDDVISMGGTLIRLVEQGHEVHVAYQTSGNLAVFDDDVVRFSEFVAQFNAMFEIDKARTAELMGRIGDSLEHKRPAQIDSDDVQRIKALIRRVEACAATRHCGVPAENLHFLDMPFYETGRVRKNALGDADIECITGLLGRIQPQQIYAAGDLSDPHGTHRTCLTAIETALGRMSAESWRAECTVWLYRGAWQEWEPEHVDMAVPLSPDELKRKIAAIFKHESQKDKALFPGTDEREFWQRAEQRNRATAQLYDAFGLAEYEAIEVFARWSEGQVQHRRASREATSTAARDL